MYFCVKIVFIIYAIRLFLLIFAPEIKLITKSAVSNLLISLIMDKKEIFKILIKVLIYALGLIASYLGITALTSCSSSHSVVSSGVTRIHITDTTYVKHNGFVRSKNYLPYE